MGNSDSSRLDPAMLELFQGEMDTHIPVLNEGLMALERGQVDAASIEAMMRAAHSIKGAARIVGIEPAVGVAHVLEDCFTAAKEGRIALRSDSVDILLRGVDALQRICAPGDDSSLDGGAMQALVDAIGSVRDGKAAPAQSRPTDCDATPSPIPQTPKSSAAGNAGGLVAATVDPGEPGIRFPASFNPASSEALRREMLDTLALRPRRIHVDMSQVSQLPAAGVALVASFLAELERTSPASVLVPRGVSPAIGSLLRIAGLAGPFGLG